MQVFFGPPKKQAPDFLTTPPKKKKTLFWTRKGYVYTNVGRVALNILNRVNCGFNSHPGQSFSLSLCGPICISRANAHMVHMG